MASRGSVAKWWLAIGVLMMAFATCWAATTEMDNDATMMTRQTRGLVLRSWRGAQHTEHQGTEKNPATKLIEQIKPSPREAMVLAGLPISMRLVLLQRLTGYDKRTPNSKAFLGMRGKKSSFWPATEVDAQEEELPELQGSSENGNSNSDDLEQLLYGHVPEKKKEKFLGMRGKKVVDPEMEPVALPYWRERNVFQQPFQQDNSKKRAPSSNSFMGMRGKRSGLMEHLPDKKTGQEQPVNGSKFSPRYDERTKN